MMSPNMIIHRCIIKAIELPNKLFIQDKKLKFKPTRLKNIDKNPIVNNKNPEISIKAACFMTVITF